MLRLRLPPPHGEKRELLSYERCFYKKFTRSKHKERNGRVHGFPYTLGPWCNSDLKVQVLNSVAKGNIRGLVLQDSQKWEECRQDQRLCRDCQNGTRAMVHERTEGCAGTFNTPPARKKLTQRLCSISESQQTNQSESSVIRKQASSSRWWKSAGMNPIAGNGVRKTICSLPFIPHLQEADAGSVTIKA